jgi:hypothetical protein
MIGAALLLLTAQPLPSAPPPVPPAAVPSLFAPPTDRPMVYRVTTRRLARDGSMASYTLVYDLQWSRAGRGVRLVATLRGIEADAPAEVVRAVTGMLRPLVDQPISYLIAPDGGDITLIDPDGLWQRVFGRVQDVAASATRSEANQVAGLLAALPPAEREKLATEDVRALVAPANPAIGEDSSIAQQGSMRMVTKSEKAAIETGTGGKQPIEIEMAWTIDTATGLVRSERRRTWIAAAGAGERRLVEERIRALDADDER